MKTNVLATQIKWSKKFLTTVTCAAAMLAVNKAYAADSGSINREFSLSGGSIDSGGGGAVECTDGSTELLDLWEATVPQIHNPPLEIIRTNEEVNVQLRRAVEKLREYDSHMPDLIFNTAKRLFDNKQYLDENIELEPPKDALTNYKKRGCKLVGMMYYDGNIQRLVVDPNRMSKLISKTDYAAAMLHEAWYYLARKNISSTPGVLNGSIKTRKLVACLFSTSKSCLEIKSAKEQIKDWNENAYESYSCKNTDEELEIYMRANSDYPNITFKRIKDRVFKKTLSYHSKYESLEFDVYDMLIPVTSILNGNYIEFNRTTSQLVLTKTSDSYRAKIYIDCEKISNN